MGALARMSPERVVPLLLHALGSPEVAVRIRAAETLGLLRDPETAPALIGLSRDPREIVRRAALKALGEIDAARRPRAAPLGARRTRAASCGSRRSSPSASCRRSRRPPTSCRSSTTPIPKMRFVTLRALGQIRNPDVVPEAHPLPRRRAKGAPLRRRRGPGGDPRRRRGAAPDGAFSPTPTATSVAPQPRASAPSATHRPCRRSSWPSRTSTGACAARPRRPSAGSEARRPRQPLLGSAHRRGRDRSAGGGGGARGDRRSPRRGRLAQALHDPGLQITALEALRRMGLAALAEIERAYPRRLAGGAAAPRRPRRQAGGSARAAAAPLRSRRRERRGPRRGGLDAGRRRLHGGAPAPHGAQVIRSIAGGAPGRCRCPSRSSLLAGCSGLPTTTSSSPKRSSGSSGTSSTRTSASSSTTAQKGSSGPASPAASAGLDLLSFEDYYHYLRFGPQKVQELQSMVSHLTNNETYFFREQPQLQVFADHVLKNLREGRPRSGERHLRILSAGCSTGEEAHTLAMIVYDSGQFFWNWDVKIVGMDVDARRPREGAARRSISTTRSAPSLRPSGSGTSSPRAAAPRSRTPSAGMVRLRQGNILEAASYEGLQRPRRHLLPQRPHLLLRRRDPEGRPALPRRARAGRLPAPGPRRVAVADHATSSRRFASRAR